MIVHGPMRMALLLLALATLGFSDKPKDPKAQARNVDFANSTSTKPFTVGTPLPATCGIGQAFFKSDSNPGQNLYLCTSTDSWTQSSGASGGVPPYIQQFLAGTNPWTITGSVHGLGANVEVFVQADSGTSWSRISPTSTTINKTNGDVTVTWAQPTTGRIMVSKLQGGSVQGGGTTDHSQLTNLSFDASGHTGFARDTHASTHKNGGADEVATTTPAGGAIPKADGTGKLGSGWIPDLSSTYELLSRKNQASGYAGLDSSTKVARAQLPVMTGDTGSGGAAGAVPAPVAGDAGRCLKGSGVWGDCGTGGGGTPGGLSGQLQYNNVGAFGGITGSTVSGNTITLTGKIDLGGGSFKVPNGAGLPGSCATGDVYLNNSASTGKKLYACEGGSWVVQGDGVGTGGGGSGGAPTDAEYIVGTANPNLDNEYIAQAGSGILITKASPNMRWEVDCSYAGCQGDDNNFSGNNQFGLGTKFLDLSIPNSTNGTTLYKLVAGTGDPLKAQRAPTGSDKLLGVCVGGCGTTGSPRIAIRGRTLCTFDNTPTAGNYVKVSDTTAGNCQDQATKPSTGYVGVVYSSAPQGGAYEVILMF